MIGNHCKIANHGVAFGTAITTLIYLQHCSRHRYKSSLEFTLSQIIEALSMKKKLDHVESNHSNLICGQLFIDTEDW